MSDYYNYTEAMTEDIRNAIPEYDLDGCATCDEVYDKVYDDLFVDDSVTGNASGSYFCNTEKSREAIRGNEKLLVEALKEFDGDYERAITEPEYADVTIRCYLLGQILGNVIKELVEDGTITLEEEEE